MCKDCDDMLKQLGLESATASDEDIQKLLAAEDILIPEVLQYTVDKIKDHGFVGGPAMLKALSLAVGVAISAAPEEIRALVFAAVVQNIGNTMNERLPDGKKVKINYGSNANMDRPFAKHSGVFH